MEDRTLLHDVLPALPVPLTRAAKSGVSAARVGAHVLRSCEALKGHIVDAAAAHVRGFVTVLRVELAASDQVEEDLAAGFWNVSREPLYLARGACPLDTKRGPTGRPVFFGRMSCMQEIPESSKSSAAVKCLMFLGTTHSALPRWATYMLCTQSTLGLPKWGHEFQHKSCSSS